MQEPNNNKYIIPLSIIIAGALIAGAVYYTKNPQQQAPAVQNQTEEIAIRPVDQNDHLLGNPAAAAIVVEYSDAQCPFCQLFHTTMHQLMDAYGKDGKIAWVYRDFPLSSLHADADRRANALECAASLGGNQKFWSLADAIYGATSTDFENPQIDLATIVQGIGISKTDFNSCIDSNKFESLIKADSADAQNAGANGTPFNVIVFKKPISDVAKTLIEGIKAQLPASAQDAIGISKDLKRVKVAGAFPYNMVKAIIDAGLANQ
jgi:protein-disulfide isomerase